MKSLMEFVSVIAILCTLGSLTWAGFGVISTSAAITGTAPQVDNGIRPALTFAAISAVVLIVAGQIRKRMS